MGFRFVQSFAIQLDKKTDCTKAGARSGCSNCVDYGWGTGLRTYQIHCKNLLDRLDMNFQVIAIVGTNTKIVNSLERHAKKVK